MPMNSSEAIARGMEALAKVGQLEVDAKGGTAKPSPKRVRGKAAMARNEVTAAGDAEAWNVLRHLSTIL